MPTSVCMGHHYYVNIPYDPNHPEPELEADRLMLQSAVVLRLGRLMLASGAGSYREVVNGEGGLGSRVGSS